MKFILALDQGTTSSRAIVFDRQGKIVAVAQKEFEQHFPKPGWVEHDAEEIWQTQWKVTKQVMTKAKIAAKDVAGIGITNQRETVVVWDRETGKPITRAIVWQDRRTAGHCDQLRKDGLGKMIRKKTGLVIDAYFSASKLAWILKNVSGARKAAKAGRLAFGTVDSWLIWKLTEGKVHVTDVTNASRTMLYNIKKGRWDSELLELFGIPEAMLPEVRQSSEIYGEAAGFRTGIPIAGIAGDQQAALFGQMCNRPGVAKNTYGTGCFMLMNTGSKPVVSKNKLLTTVAWKVDGKTEFALEGSVFVAGAVVQWLRDGLGLIKRAADVEALAASVEDNGGVYVVPAFAGLGTPHWDAYARGTMVGLTRGSSKGHIARAALESIAYQTKDVLRAMEADTGLPLKELRVDGGASMNNLLMQFQSDILGVPVLRPTVSETTALGAAYLAGLAVGYWESQADIAEQWQVDARFEPAMKGKQRRALYGDWQRAVERSQGWVIAGD